MRVFATLKNDGLDLRDIQMKLLSPKTRLAQNLVKLTPDFFQSG
jgi:hypothetical protein